MKTTNNDSGGTLGPLAWTERFADALVILFPSVDRRIAERIAHGQASIDFTIDPIMAAERYALNEGKPET